MISTFLILIISITSYAQNFKNLEFLQKCDSSKTGLCDWDLSWGGKNSVTPALYESKHTILIEGKSENSVGFVEQSTSTVEVKEVHILSISAIIKSDSITGKGAGLNIGLYDINGTLIANKDMGGFYSIDWIKGTNDWKKYTISIVVPTETTKIKIGMILYGMGKAWFSDFDVKFTSIRNRKSSKLAIQYISDASDTIAKNSLVRDSININNLKETALKIAGPAKNYRDCFLAINFLLESLRTFGDHHSFFMSVNEVKNWESEGSQVSEIQFPLYEVLDSIGYILVPPFHGGNPLQIKAYADSMQLAIENLYNAQVKGWIIDLRQNTGGNMEPMIAGLGPLFSSEKLGSLIDVDGNSDSWYYKDGRYFGDGYKGWSVSNPFKPPLSHPIAVLTSSQTGSSGEIVAISFIGNLNTKSFGQPTWGLTTGNGSFELKDGSQIFLASTVMSDRNGKEYITKITPDFTIEDDLTNENDEVINAAKKWILKTK